MTRPWRTLIVASLIALTAGLPLGLGACDDPPPFPDPPDASAPPCTVQPTLSSLKQVYFANSCVFSGCHSKSRPEAHLDLSAANLHALLVGVPADDPEAAARGKVRVLPGDPDHSFMVEKLENRQLGDEGGIMPDQSDGPLDPECRIKMLRQWISDGALDN